MIRKRRAPRTEMPQRKGGAKAAKPARRAAARKGAAQSRQSRAAKPAKASRASRAPAEVGRHGGKAAGAKKGRAGTARAKRAALRLIPLEDSPHPDILRAMEAQNWKYVDGLAKDQIARRRPPAELVARAAAIADILGREFPRAVTALDYRTPLEMLVATILSAQCTDARVNMVTPDLFKRYPTAADYAASPPGELEEAIRSTGFYNNKAKAIRSCCREIVETYGGVVPSEMEKLSSLHGVGRKTAAVVRANAFGLPGITVDTHVHRVARRLKLTDDTDPARIEFDLGSQLPPERWSQFSHALVLHGRKTCSARKPRCAACPIQELCPSAFRVEE